MRLLGSLPDPPHRRYGAELSGLVGRSPVIADAVDWSYLVPVPLDQHGQSCAGAAIHHALQLCARHEGWDLDASYLAIYALARELEHPGADVLPDVGCYISRCIEALTAWGIVSSARWPERADLSRSVPIDVLEAGATALVTGVYRIEVEGEARVLAIRAALSAGHAVVFGMPVDEAYEAGPGNLYAGLTGSSRGGHAQCLAGFRDGAMRVVGSWGPRWNGDGTAWLADSFMASPRIYDVTVLTAAPRSVR